MNSSTKSKKKKKTDEEDDFGPKFKVIIEKAEPAGVKISKKNCCTIEVRSGEIDEVLEEEQLNLISYYLPKSKRLAGKINSCRLACSVQLLMMTTWS